MEKDSELYLEMEALKMQKEIEEIRAKSAETCMRMRCNADMYIARVPHMTDEEIKDHVQLSRGFM